MDDEARAEWDRAWSSMPHHAVIAWSNEAVRGILGDSISFERLIAMSVSADPAAYADKIYRATAVCPICGAMTDSTSRVAATIHPVVDLGEKLGQKFMGGYGVWVHQNCFDRCPITYEPTPIPW